MKDPDVLSMLFYGLFLEQCQLWTSWFWIIVDSSILQPSEHFPWISRGGLGGVPCFSPFWDRQVFTLSELVLCWCRFYGLAMGCAVAWGHLTEGNCPETNYNSPTPENGWRMKFPFWDAIVFELLSYSFKEGYRKKRWIVVTGLSQYHAGFGGRFTRRLETCCKYSLKIEG